MPQEDPDACVTRLELNAKVSALLDIIEKQSEMIEKQSEMISLLSEKFLLLTTLILPATTKGDNNL